MQSALLRSPGEFSALGIWQYDGERSVAWEALARLLREGEESEEARIVVAIRPGNIEHPHVLPREGDGWTIPSTQSDALVQIASETREGMLWALHRAHDLLTGALVCGEEILGGKIGDGREPFGFKDGVTIPDAKDARKAAIVAEGELAGASWVLFVRFQSDLNAFRRLREGEQERVFGIRRDDTPLVSPPKNAHAVLMSRYARPGDFAFIRRSFPFRQTQHEGLAFLAASKDPHHFEQALDSLLGSAGKADALLSFVRAVGGGLYLAPPDAAWLERQARLNS